MFQPVDIRDQRRVEHSNWSAADEAASRTRRSDGLERFDVADRIDRRRHGGQGLGPLHSRTTGAGAPASSFRLAIQALA